MAIRTIVRVGLIAAILGAAACEDLMKGGGTNNEQQNSAKSDAKNVADQIRRDIDAQPALKEEAKDVKIDTTQDGRVTLKGSVDSQAAHDQVLQIVKKYAVADKIDDQIQVKPGS